MNVTRDRRGRLVSWETVVENVYNKAIFGKGIAVYGTAHNRFGIESKRYEFYGTGRDLERTVRTRTTSLRRIAS